MTLTRYKDENNKLSEKVFAVDVVCEEREHTQQTITQTKTAIEQDARGGVSHESFFRVDDPKSLADLRNISRENDFRN